MAIIRKDDKPTKHTSSALLETFLDSSARVALTEKQLHKTAKPRRKEPTIKKLL